LKSRNGTFVNKSRISSPYRLHHGDLVQFGSGGPVFVFELDPPFANSAKRPRKANDSVRPTNTHSDVFRHANQIELDDLTGHQSNSNLLSTWKRHQLLVIVVCMLFVMASVVLSLMLLEHDMPSAHVTLVPKTTSLTQPTNKTDIKTLPDKVQTEKPVRGLVGKAAPVPEQISVPDKVETSVATIPDNIANKSVEKVSTDISGRNKIHQKVEAGTPGVHKTQKKVKASTSSAHKTQKKVEADTLSAHKTQKKVKAGTSSAQKTQKKVKADTSSAQKTKKKVEAGTSSVHKTQKKVKAGTPGVNKSRKKGKTQSSQTADDWKVIEHQ
jgi:pSer/pThr/pTyr-binding forkhead associated (FHA) protein